MENNTQGERKCPFCKINLQYKGMEDVHTGGRVLEIVEFLASVFAGLSILAIALRDIMVKRTTFDFYVCPQCHYTVFVEETGSKIDGDEQVNFYAEYRKTTKKVANLLNEINIQIK